MQLIESQDQYIYKFYQQGYPTVVSVYEERHYESKQFLPPPVKIDYAKNIISPMPGSIVSVDVKPGDKVSDG